MRLPAVRVLGLLLLVAATAPSARAAPAMTDAERRQIGAVVDAFVKDAVLRKDLAAGWRLAGPDLRGGTTRRAWVSGSGVTVPYYPAHGADFSHDWTGGLVAPGRAQLALVLHPAPGSGYDQAAATLDVRRVHGRWVVDVFYLAVTFRSGAGHRGSCGTPDCAISGPNDFGPAASAAAPARPRVGGRTVVAVLAALAGLVVLSPVAVWLVLRRRDRRIRADYERSII